MLSQEYVAAIVLIVGAILKAFGIELGNEVLEGIIAGALALWIAIRRYKKGDINLAGIKK